MKEEILFQVINRLIVKKEVYIFIIQPVSLNWFSKNFRPRWRHLDYFDHPKSL